MRFSEIQINPFGENILFFGYRFTWPPPGSGNAVIVATTPLECLFCTVYKIMWAGIFVGISHLIQI